MIISKNSILNQLPKDKLTEREIIFFETIIHSSIMIGLSYERLVNLLNLDDDQLATELPMIDVWHIIDCSHRLGCIIEKTPGIKKNSIWFQKTVKMLRETEPIRNFIQHYK